MVFLTLPLKAEAKQLQAQESASRASQTSEKMNEIARVQLTAYGHFAWSAMWWNYLRRMCVMLHQLRRLPISETGAEQHRKFIVACGTEEAVFFDYFYYYSYTAYTVAVIYHQATVSSDGGILTGWESSWHSWSRKPQPCRIEQTVVPHMRLRWGWPSKITHDISKQSWWGVASNGQRMNGCIKKDIKQHFLSHYTAEWAEHEICSVFIIILILFIFFWLLFIS